MQFKLGKVVANKLGPGGVPYIVTHDGKTMRYPNPDTKVYDTVKIDLETTRPMEILKFEIGAQVYCNSGRNKGRIGILVARDRHPGMFDIVHVKDLAGNTVSFFFRSHRLHQALAHTSVCPSGLLIASDVFVQYASYRDSPTYLPAIDTILSCRCSLLIACMLLLSPHSSPHD